MKRVLHGLVFCILVVLLNVACTKALDLSNIETKINKFPEISHADLLQLIKDNDTLIIDVNGTESYNTGHIPGAIDYALYKGELESKLPEDKDKLIVCYCGSPKCSAWYKAASEAESYGYKNVKRYKEGIKGWIKYGGSLEEDSSV